MKVSAGFPRNAFFILKAASFEKCAQPAFLWCVFKLNLPKKPELAKFSAGSGFFYESFYALLRFLHLCAFDAGAFNPVLSRQDFQRQNRRYAQCPDNSALHRPEWWAFGLKSTKGHGCRRQPANICIPGQVQ